MEPPVYVAETRLLGRMLVTRDGFMQQAEDVSLGSVLKEVLSWANRFVPSISGSILLDSHRSSRTPISRRRLYFAACFGPGSEGLIGSYIHGGKGIAGETYSTGRSYISMDVSHDKKFHGTIDKKLKHKSESIVCAPIVLKGTIIGVVELINRRNKPSYSMDDLKLLEIFAGYTASFIENALTAREFEELSRVDDLTKLYNDRHFFTRLEREMSGCMAGGTDTSLMFFDLDRFKEVNDNYGHLAGSEVLREVARILRRIFLKNDAVMARYGGDEFVVIMPGADIAEASLYAERIRDEIAINTFLSRKTSSAVQAHKISGIITCSLGLASYSRNLGPRKSAQELAEALIRASDRAMYKAKETGRNKVVVSDEVIV